MDTRIGACLRHFVGGRFGAKHSVIDERREVDRVRHEGAAPCTLPSSPEAILRAASQNARMRSKLEIAFELDRRWRLLRGEMDGSKRAALIELARILAEARVPYAVILDAAP
jgi:hypothetical protein